MNVIVLIVNGYSLVCRNMKEIKVNIPSSIFRNRDSFMNIEKVLNDELSFCCQNEVKRKRLQTIHRFLLNESYGELNMMKRVNKEKRSRILVNGAWMLIKSPLNVQNEWKRKFLYYSN